MPALTSRERVLRTLNHERVDRVPIDLGGRISSMAEGIYTKLKDYFDIYDHNGSESINPFLTIEDYDERILEAFNVDFRRVYFNGPESIIIQKNPDGTYINEWGLTIQKIGPYIQRITHPLRSANIDDLNSYRWPNPSRSQEEISKLREKARYLYENTNYAIVADAVNGGIFEYAQHLRGMEEFFTDMMVNKKFANALLDKILGILISFYNVYLDIVGEYVQIVLYPDDYGMQTDLLISPKLFREMIKPRVKKLFDFIKSKTNAKMMIHTDGSVYNIIDDLIEIGVDILNPCQPYAKDMEPEKLKSKFGQRIVFHGGIDQQKILRKGNIQDVRDEVKQKIEDFASGGGYILAPAHNIEEDTPVENVIAVFEAAKEFGKY